MLYVRVNLFLATLKASMCHITKASEISMRENFKNSKISITVNKLNSQKVNISQ